MIKLMFEEEEKHRLSEVNNFKDLNKFKKKQCKHNKLHCFYVKLMNNSVLIGLYLLKFQFF